MTATDARYRSAWVAVQEDGTRVTLRSVEYLSLEEAVRDRDEAVRFGYIADAWVERAEWQRWPADVPSE